MISEKYNTNIISITSGKGGVGKTTLVSNLAYALSKMQKKVLIFDADLGMANVDIFFSTKAKGHLLEVLLGNKSLNSIVTNIAPHIDLISGGNGWAELTRLNPFERRQILEAISSVIFQYDFLIIDTAPGISDNVLHLNSAADDILIIINSDPASFTDSYALLKLLHSDYRRNHFSIVVNQVKDDTEGFILFRKFNDVVSRFLHVGLAYLGSIPQDPLVRRSNQLQRLVLQHEPLATSVRPIIHIASELQRNFGFRDHKVNNFWTPFTAMV